MLRIPLMGMIALLLALSLPSYAVKVPPTLAAAQEDKEFQAELKRLSDGERKLIGQYMMRMSIGAIFPGANPPPSGVTLAEAISSQNAFISQQDEKEKSEEAIVSALAQAVELSDIRVEKATESGYRDGTIKVSVRAKNASKKTIAGIKVAVQASDIFGDKLGSYGLKSDATITPGGEATLSGHFSGDKFLKADQSKIDLSAASLHIVFEDRSELKTPRTIIGF